MNPVLAEILQTQMVMTAAGERVPLHSHLPVLEGELLQQWLGQYKPTRLLEIGLAYGVSSLYICDAVARWQVADYQIIDAFQSTEWLGIGVQNLQRAGYGDSFVLHEQLSELCLPQLLAQGLRFDFAFIDGWHTFDHVLLEFFYINRLLDVGGVVIFDDVHLPALQKVLAYVRHYPCYEPLSIPPNLASSKPLKVRRMMNLPPVRIAGFVKTAVDERSWEWFEDF